MRFSFCRRLQNHTRTVSRSISSSSANFDISADVGREFRKNDISSATKNQHILTRDHEKLSSKIKFIHAANAIFRDIQADYVKCLCEYNI